MGMCKQYSGSNDQGPENQGPLRGLRNSDYIMII